MEHVATLRELETTWSINDAADACDVLDAIAAGRPREDP